MDSAQAYGVSEEMIGKYWPQGRKKRIVSKHMSGLSPEQWENKFHESLKRLNIDCMDSYLVHNKNDFKGPNGLKMMNWLHSLKERGLTQRVGISIYDKEDLEEIPWSIVDLVQLPLSIYDQRHVENGTIDMLNNMGKSVHVRSVFLQGLILQEPDSMPNFISKEFKKHHRKWLSSIKERNSNPLAEAINFINKYKNIEAMVVGVTNTAELKEIVKYKKEANSQPLGEDRKWQWNRGNDLDPRQWGK